MKFSNFLFLGMGIDKASRRLTRTLRASLNIDILVLENLEDGNLISDADVARFKRNGNLNELSTPFYTPSSMGKPGDPAHVDTGVWAMMELMKGIKQEMGQMRVVVDRIDQKTGN